MKLHMIKCLAAVMMLAFCLSGCGQQTDTRVPEDMPPNQEHSEGVSDKLPDQTITTYTFMEGTREENSVTVITSEKEGPCIYIAAGIHGDETAGWTAANELKDEIEIGCGTLYILGPVNRSGAEANTRFVVDSGDMNRVFPGNADSTDMAERLAAALYADVERVKPDLILDLHEARLELSSGDTYAGLANTLIYTDDTKIADLLFDFTIANEEGEVCHRKFGLTTPGIAGSFNRVVSEQLEIPVITTETWRKLELEERVEEQKEIVYFCLNHYGMPAQPKGE